MGVEHGNLLVATPSKGDSPLPPQATPNQLFSEIKMIFKIFFNLHSADVSLVLKLSI